MKDPTLENEQKFKNYEDKLSLILRNSERLYYRNELEKAKLDNRQTWMILKKIICRGKINAGNIPDIFIESNKKYYERKAIDNVFHNYLTDVGPSISSKNSHVNGSIYDYLNKKCKKSVFLMSVTESQVVSVVNELSFK